MIGQAQMAGLISANGGKLKVARQPCQHVNTSPMVSVIIIIIIVVVVNINNIWISKSCLGSNCDNHSYDNNSDTWRGGRRGVFKGF